MKITSCIGDTNTPKACAQIVVTVPKWVENRIGGRSPMDLSHLKMVIFDEADEIFMQAPNHQSIHKLVNHLNDKIKNTSVQTILFSATFDDVVVDNISKFYTC